MKKKKKKQKKRKKAVEEDKQKTRSPEMYIVLALTFHSSAKVA